MTDVTSKGIEATAAQDIATAAKPKWEKPEIMDFQPITVSRGHGMTPGDMFQNLT